MRVEVAMIVDGDRLMSKKEAEDEMALLNELLPNAKSWPETRLNCKAVIFEVDFYEWYRGLRDSITEKVKAMQFTKMAMGKCKECRFWQTVKELVCDDKQKACMCPKIFGNVDGMDREDADDKEVLADASACCRGGNLMTRPEFGCVCFEAKPEKQGAKK